MAPARYLGTGRAELLLTTATPERMLVETDRPQRSCSARFASCLLVVAVLACALLGGVLVTLLLGSPSFVNRVAPPLTASAGQPIVASVAPTLAATYDQKTVAPADGQIRPHIVLTPGKSVTAPTTRFSFDGVRYEIKPHVDSAVYHGAKASTRLLAQPEGESDEAWSQTYYRSFAEDPAQQATVDDLASQLQRIRDRAGLDSDQYLELIAKYVQSIPYDNVSYESGKGHQRFPVETLVDGTGMCGDKSVLLGVLLAHEGYAVALLDFKPEKHMAVGVRGPGAAFGDTGWLFLETTGPCYVTDVPDTYLGGVKLTSEPTIITIGTGTKQYGAAADVARIVRARDGAESAASALYARARGEQLTRSQASVVNRKLDTAYRATVSLRSNAVDSKGRPIGTFLDRMKAKEWVDRNAWWL